MRVSLAATAAILVTFACADQPLTSPDALSVSPNFNANPVIERVNAAGNDACEALGQAPGCDKNFSFHAHLRADGSVTGQYQDGFSTQFPNDGIHAVLDCMNIVGNGAVVSGVITKGQQFGVDVTGQTLITAVVDNGKNRPEDTPDQISFSFSDSGFTCTDLVPGNFPLLDMTNGQVTIK